MKNIFNVIIALFLREIQTRFLGKSYGYIWTFLEPIIPIIFIIYLKNKIMEQSNLQYDFVVFLASGFIAYSLFKNIVKKSMEAFNSNQALFNYRQIKPIYTIISRILVEVIIFAVMIVFFLAIGSYFNFNIQVNNLSLFLLAIFWFFMFSVSIGILAATITFLYESLKNIINILFLPLFFLSGLFYTMKDLPVDIRNILDYNPVIHFVEFVHCSYIEQISTEFIDFNYMIYWTITPLFLGLYLYYLIEKKVISK